MHHFPTSPHMPREPQELEDPAGDLFFAAGGRQKFPQNPNFRALRASSSLKWGVGGFRFSADTPFGLGIGRENRSTKPFWGQALYDSEIDMGVCKNKLSRLEVVGSLFCASIPFQESPIWGGLEPVIHFPVAILVKWGPNGHSSPLMIALTAFTWDWSARISWMHLLVQCCRIDTCGCRVQDSRQFRCFQGLTKGVEVVVQLS